MKVRITPSTAHGLLQAPPSKSAAHRALIAAALSESCTVCGVGDSQDMRATIGCLVGMGAQVRREGDRITLGGLVPQNIPACRIDCGESGSTLRFLIPLCLLGHQPVELVCHGRLASRPLEEYRQLCKEKGCRFEQKENVITVCGPLSAGAFSVAADRSSQFVTGLLLALPLLPGESTLELRGKRESMSYVALTIQVQRAFGIQIDEVPDGYRIVGGGRYQRNEFTVEGDWSNAAFPLALNVLGGAIDLQGLQEDSVQGDKVCLAYFEKLGTETLDLSDCPDLAPVLFALAAVKGGRFVGCRRLRLKESDRIAAMQTELAKCGIMLQADEDTVQITPAGLRPPVEEIDGQGDHRIVMAMTVLLSRLGGCIRGAEAVAKSWPEFFEAMKAVGIEVKIC